MIAFIGDVHSLTPFKLLGFKTLEAGTPEEADKLLSDIGAGDYEAVFITEELLEKLHGQADKYPFHMAAIPGIGGSRGLGRGLIREMLKRALGAETG